MASFLHEVMQHVYSKAVKIYEFWIPIYGSRFVRISILMSTNMCFDFDQSYRLANFQISTKCKASFPALFENICLFSNKIRIKTYFSWRQDWDSFKLGFIYWDPQLKIFTAKVAKFCIFNSKKKFWGTFISQQKSKSWCFGPYLTENMRYPTSWGIRAKWLCINLSPMGPRVSSGDNKKIFGQTSVGLRKFQLSKHPQPQVV